MSKVAFVVLIARRRRPRGRGRLLVRAEAAVRPPRGRARPVARAAAAPRAAARAVRRAGGQPISVEATPVAVASLPQIIVAVGSLRSDESVTVRPEIAGRISAIGFTEGQRVQKGAMLVKLDAAINEAEVQQARANLELAKSKFDRAVDLAKSNFISGQARDEAESNFKVAEAALALAEARLARTEIRAPFSGLIGLRQVSLGDYVKEGADLVNLESIDPLKVDFRVPEVYLKQIRAGQALQITLDAIPGRTYTGPRAGDQSAGRRRRPRDRDPRAGQQPRHEPAARHVRARAAHHRGSRRRAGRARAGARAAGPGPVRVPHRRRQGPAREGRDRPARRRQGGDPAGPRRRRPDRRRRPAQAARRRRGALAVAKAPPVANGGPNDGGPPPAGARNAAETPPAKAAGGKS